jgi:DNA-binding response OmpR family regulator
MMPRIVVVERDRQLFERIRATCRIVWPSAQVRRVDRLSQSKSIEERGGLDLCISGIDRIGRSGLGRLLSKQRLARTPLLLLSDDSKNPRLAEILVPGVDYIEVPFSPVDLIGRVVWLLEEGRSEVIAAQCQIPARFTMGRMTSQVTEMELVNRSESIWVDLTATERLLYRTLLNRNGRAIAGRVLLTTVGISVTEATLQSLGVQLRRLNRKLGESAEALGYVSGDADADICLMRSPSPLREPMPYPFKETGHCPDLDYLPARTRSKHELQ